MKRRDVFILLFIFALPLIEAIRTGYVVDDAFISFRYARNLVSGLGLVFNPAQRVEGYTNFLWTLLMVPAFWLKTGPLLYSRIISSLAGFFTLVVLFRFERLHSLTRPGVATAAVLILVCHASFPVWLLAGLETHLFTLLVTAGVLSFLNRRNSLHPAWPLLFALASLTRPEGFLFYAIAWCVVLAGHVRTGHLPSRRELQWNSIPFLALILPYLAWKLLYYGALIPNTFQAKVGTEVSQVVRGLQYMNAFIHTSGGPVFAVPLILACTARGRKLLSGILPFVLPYAAYVILVGGDAMVKFRFLLPITPLLCILVAESLGVMSSIIANRTYSTVAFVMLTLASMFLTVDVDRSLVERRREMVRDWIETGQWLAVHYPADTVIALGAIGAIPYYSNFTTIDMFGLTEPSIARKHFEDMGKGLPGHEKRDAAYVLSRRPDLIFPKVVLTAHHPEEEDYVRLFSGSRAEIQMWREPDFHRDYRPVIAKLTRGYLTFFARAR